MKAFMADPCPEEASDLRWLSQGVRTCLRCDAPDTAIQVNARNQVGARVRPRERVRMPGTVLNVPDPPTCQTQTGPEETVKVGPDEVDAATPLAKCACRWRYFASGGYTSPAWAGKRP